MVVTVVLALAALSCWILTISAIGYWVEHEQRRNRPPFQQELQPLYDSDSASGSEDLELRDSSAIGTIQVGQPDLIPARENPSLSTLLHQLVVSSENTDPSSVDEIETESDEGSSSSEESEGLSEVFFGEN